MAAEKIDVLLIGPEKPVIAKGLNSTFNVVKLPDANAREKFFSDQAPRIRGMAVAATSERIDGPFMSRFARLEIVSSFGVGYDHIDAAWAGGHGITVTNTPDVLTEEVADTALGLLLCTVREFPQAERYLRSGHWRQGDYPLSKATLRDRTVGLVGMGRIGQAIARRLDAMRVPVVYHSRRPAPDIPYQHYPNLLDMARQVEVLLVITPGGAQTRNLINAEVLAALGRQGILINMARGSVVDEPALIKALQAGDHFVRRPRRLCTGAACAAGADRDGQCGALSSPRLRVGDDPPKNGPARRGQSPRVGGRQAPAHPGRRNTLSWGEDRMKRRTMRPRECVLMLCDQQRHKLRLALRSLWAGLSHMARLQGANSIPPPVRGHSGGGIAAPLACSAAMTAVGLWFGHALAQAPAGAPSETAQGMVGAWEISNAARDKTCAVSFSVDAGEGGFKLDLDPTCRTVFPSLRDVGAWAIGPKDSVHLLDAKGAVVLDFAEVEVAHVRGRAQGRGTFLHAHPSRHPRRNDYPGSAVRRLDPAAGVREATLQADAVEHLGGRDKLSDHRQAGLYCLHCRLCAFHLADRGQRAGVRRPLGRLAIFRKRCNHLGAHPAQHRSAADDAPVSPL